MGCPDLSGKSIRAAVQRSSSSGVCAAPHPPAGTFSPYSDGEKGSTPRPVTPLSPFLHGERVR
ncbi:hypothetical protein EOB49_25530 [Mesorhizobium sp. M7A.F.Ca.MR.148.00.0.0]|nr:hypothetical protein EOB49_25530 [Mesorhizobium sp. M7A.F.Ca.MR.148.00.0.0]